MVEVISCRLSPHPPLCEETLQASIDKTVKYLFSMTTLLHFELSITLWLISCKNAAMAVAGFLLKVSFFFYYFTALRNSSDILGLSVVPN